MCGIAGVLDASRSAGETELADIAMRMGGALEHRGPDDGGRWIDPAAGVVLAHRRLAVIDLSDTGHQPMTSASGRWVIVFNGEIYNYRDMREELTSSGTRMRGDSDTEVLLEYVDRHGPAAALRRSDGMFALALWDRQERRLWLARDRVGEKPLYYGWSGRRFFFGSELKALRAHPGFRASVDRDALAAYLRLSYVPTPYSIYFGIAKLPPGTLVEIDPDDVGNAGRPVTYWEFPRPADPTEGTTAERLDRLDELLRSAVASRMVADVPVGAFLSGGIDSSIIVALMTRATSSTVRTFSIGFHEAEYDEAPHAAAVAAHLGTEHEQLYVTADEALAVVPRLSEIYDEPFADSSQVPTFLVSEMTRRHVTVALSGDAGDELFGGYDRYRVHLALWRVLGRTPAPLRRAAGRGVRRVDIRTWDRVGAAVNATLPARHRQARFGDKAHKAAGLLTAGGPAETYRVQMSQWADPTSVVPGAVEPWSLLADPDAWPASSPLAQVMYVDALTYLPDDILTKVDRAAMALSLETRVPFLDPAVIEFAMSIPDDERRRDGQGKWLLRTLLDRYVPRSLVDRPKMGFGVPIGHWLRGPLRPWAEDLLSEASIRAEGHLAVEPVRDVWRRHLSGAEDLKYPLWNVLMYLEWARAANVPPTGRK